MHEMVIMVNISNVLNSEMGNLNNYLFTHHELKGVSFPRSSDFFLRKIIYSRTILFPSSL